MINNPYTIAIDSVRAPALAVENAIKYAKRRAARRASVQVRAGYAAAAASVVIAGAAGILYLNSGFEPPVSPVQVTQTASLPTRASESAAVPSVKGTAPPTAAKPSEKTAESTKPSEPASTAQDASQPSRAQTESTVSATQSVTEDAEKPAVIPTQKATSKPTDKPSDKPAETESGMVEVSPIEVEVDSSRLSDDGKLYCVIAETGYDVAGDPDAFSDSRVYYVETKFGRYKQPFGAWWVESESLDNLSYIFYNSDGIVVYTEPVASR